MADPETWKRMRLRYSGDCRQCGATVPQGERAVYDKSARNVLCLGCADRVLSAAAAAVAVAGSESTVVRSGVSNMDIAT